MVAIIRPERHLSLAVVQAVQRPPPIKTMLGTMNPIFSQVNDEQRYDKGADGVAGQPRDQVFDVRPHQIMHPKPRIEFVDGNHQHKKNQQGQHTHPVQPGVDHVSTPRAVFRPLLHRTPRFQRFQQQAQCTDFQHAHHRHAQPFVDRFRVRHKIESKQQRLNPAFEKPSLCDDKRLIEFADHAAPFSVSKQNPRALSPVSSGSNTAGAQPSLRERMPRCMTRMSPSRISRSAFFSSSALG